MALRFNSLMMKSQIGSGLSHIKALTQIDILDHPVDHQGFADKTKSRKESGGHIKYHKCHQNGETVHQQQHGSNIETGVFFKDHGDNICSTTGRTNVK